MPLNFPGVVGGAPTEFVNYDYFDWSNATGYDVYYGAKGDNGEYFTTIRPIYSEEIATAKEDEAITTSFVKEFDIDFDIDFNVPKNIRGVIIANIPMGMKYESNVGETFYMYAIVRAYHWDGASETLIGTGTSITSDENLDTDSIFQMARTHLCKIDAALTHFKKGESLRFTVEGWFKADTSRNCDLIIGHDPANRNYDEANPQEPQMRSDLANEGTMLPTQMSFHVPFRIER